MFNDCDVALIHRILLFFVSIVFIIFLLIGATASYSKEQSSAEKFLIIYKWTRLIYFAIYKTVTVEVEEFISY